MKHELPQRIGDRSRHAVCAAISLCLFSCDLSKFVPEVCGADPNSTATPKRRSLRSVERFEACARDPNSPATRCAEEPTRLDIAAGQKGLIDFNGDATHDGSDPSMAPAICGAAFGSGWTPLGFAIGGPVYPVRQKFRFEGAAIVECTTEGLIKRIDDGKGFESEADVNLQLVVKERDPRIGPLSRAIHVRCLGGTGTPPNETVNDRPVCGCSGLLLGPSLVLLTLLHLRRARGRRARME